ncbi:MAG: hypothetical protein QOD06_802 [Candidatus Binatota bacterium]|jgi:steroid delta-isomerase-like uncharacterized protein|nr:hypothetical protein [Candidatus Binatota bacterium]
MNMAWAKKWMLDNFNERDLDGISKLYHPKVRFEDVPLGVRADGIEGVREFLGGFFQPSSGKHAFNPDAYLGNEREGVVEWTWTATLGEADLFGTGSSPKGKSFEIRGNSVFRFDAAGLVVEERDYWDVASVLKQIGDTKQAA